MRPANQAELEKKGSAMDTEQLRSDLLGVTKLCYASRMQTGNGGNLSARVPGSDHMVVKASGAAFSTSEPEDMVIADFDGSLVEGKKKPSRESLLHGALYRAFPGLGSIVHCHSPWATGWAATLRPLPHATYHSAIKLGSLIPVFDTGSYVVPESFFPKIIAALRADAKTKAFLLKGHGQVALGTTPFEAFYNAELVEETAHIAIAAAMAGKTA